MNNINNLKLSVNKRIIKVDLVNEIIQKSSISSKRRVVITISGIANLRERERERERERTSHEVTWNYFLMIQDK
jgi:hypothetical protein